MNFDVSFSVKYFMLFFLLIFFQSAPSSAPAAVPADAVKVSVPSPPAPPRAKYLEVCHPVAAAKARKPKSKRNNVTAWTPRYGSKKNNGTSSVWPPKYGGKKKRKDMRYENIPMHYIHDTCRYKYAYIRWLRSL